MKIGVSVEYVFEYIFVGVYMLDTYIYIYIYIYMIAGKVSSPERTGQTCDLLENTSCNKQTQISSKSLVKVLN